MNKTSLSQVGMATIKIDKVTETTYTLSGELTRETVPTVCDFTSQLFSNSHVRQIVCDCARVTQIDSAGIAALLNWKRHALSKQSQIFFTHIPPRMQSLIDVSRLTDVFIQDQIHG